MADDRRDGADSPVWDGEDATGEQEEIEPPPANANKGRVLSLKAVKAEPMELQRRADPDDEVMTPPRRAPPPPFPAIPGIALPSADSQGAPHVPMSRRGGDGISDSETPSPRRGSPPPAQDSKVKVESSQGLQPKVESSQSFQPMLRIEGRVKHFDEEKGFGFVYGSNKDEDYFVHFSGIAGRGFRKLEKGQQVLFDTEWNDQKQKPQAVNVRLICPGNESGHRKMTESSGGKRQRSRSPRVGKDGKKVQDEDPLYEAVNDTLTWLFREVLETDTALHKKVVGYLRQAVKRTSFEGNILDIFQLFADHFFGSLFSAYGDRPWLREAKVDFAWCFDVTAQELFPEDLVSRFDKSKESKGQLAYLLHKAHDIKYDWQRFVHFLHECVKGGCRIEGKKTQNKVSEACISGRSTAITQIKQSIGIDVWNSREERNFDIQDLEAFTQCWIQSTVKEVKARGTHEGCGLDGILTRSNAVALFNSLLQERAFPQIMTRSLKHEWPATPWPFIKDTIDQLYSGGAFGSAQEQPLSAIMDAGAAPEGPIHKYNAQIQRQQRYGRRHRHPGGPGDQLPLPSPGMQLHRSSSSTGVQHFGTDEPMPQQPSGQAPRPQPALTDYQTRRAAYGRGDDARPPQPPALTDMQARRASYGQSGNSSREGDLHSRPGQYPPRISYGGQERGPGRFQVKQEMDEQGRSVMADAKYGKGETGMAREMERMGDGKTLRKVLPRSHPDSDSEDDYNGKGGKMGKGKMEMSRNGRGCYGKDGGHFSKGRLLKSEVKEEIQEEFHQRAW